MATASTTMAKSMYGEQPQKALIVGSSFVRRLRDDIRSENSELLMENFGLDLMKVCFMCKGGWRLADVEHRLEEIRQLAPDFVFVQVGANDLAQAPGPGPGFDMVGERLVHLAERIQHLPSVKAVTVGQSMNRRVGKYIRTPAEEKLFNNQAQSLNTFLKRRCADESNVIYWRHKGLTCPSESGRGDTLGADGVHLSQRGQYKFFKSIKGALVHMRGRQARDPVAGK